jgi:CRP-like cAMP-binding protein
MVNANLFRQLVPLASLTATDRAELARVSRSGTFQPGHVLFSRGESAKTVVYLLSGEVELFSEGGAKLVKGGTPEALHPISQGARRCSTATCMKPSQALFVDRERLDMFLTWSQTGGVEVVELGQDSDAGEGDWMTALLQSPAFERIPPGNIGQIFAAMHPVEFAPGATIITAGEPGDFYYVITEGRVAVARESEAGGADAGPVELGVGRGFGEEALISGNPRNATVVARTKCALMRLSAADFARLLKAPILKEIGADEIPNDAILIDVRLPAEYRKGRLPDSVNMPLSKLRDMAVELDPRRCYVVYCDSGRRSASATYLLSERGFDARLLSGGIPADEMPVRG